ncbi:MAG: MarC family protein [Myxococcales bacterium]|jgi:multiple antibiotic resistance protein|nr:MarC family protein [Myxococcales bacterium]
MIEFLTFAIMAFSMLFFVMDPLGNLPIFITLTANETATQRRLTARRASIAAFVILFCCTLGGSYVFRLFGLTLDAFRIAGGVLLFLIGLDMLRAQPSRTRSSPEETDEGVQKDDVAIVPLAMPLLAGPGTVASVMVLASQNKDWRYTLIVIAVVALCCLASWLILRAADPISHLLGHTGIAVFERIMGLLVVAIAIQFMADGAIGLLTNADITMSAGGGAARSPSQGSP